MRIALAILLAACSSMREPVPLGDAGPPRDAAPPPPFDAGPPQPVVDGIVTDTEWRSGTTARASTPTDAPGSTLTALRARVRDARLFVAVEGSLAAGDTILVYVDNDLGGSDGVDDTALLTDEIGPLDAQMSRVLEPPAAFRADLAWGTRSMPHVAAGADLDTGWRDLADAPDAFGIVTSEDAPTICSESACETSIALSRLGGTRPRTIALFARLVRADATLSNQCVPEDLPATPSVITSLLTLDDGNVMRDGGVPPMPDGGTTTDAGTRITIDGRLGAGEWDGARVYTTSASTAATPFAGNALTSLRAMRDSARVYLAIEATLTADNAVVVYVDHDLGGADGILGTPFSLADFQGALDSALSKDVFTPIDFRLDLAWGTTSLPLTATDGDPSIGWRDVDTASGLFTPVPIAMAPSVCGADVCETAIELDALGVAPSASVALFARLVARVGGMSNQTLPADDPSAPDFVSEILVLGP